MVVQSDPRKVARSTNISYASSKRVESFVAKHLNFVGLKKFLHLQTMWPIRTNPWLVM